MDDDDGLTELRIGDLVVDLAEYTVLTPEGESWERSGDIDEGLISEASVRDRSLSLVAEVLGELSEHVENGAPEGWMLEVDPKDRSRDLELHEGIALESFGSDELYVTVSIGLPAYFDGAFEEAVEGVVEPMLRHAGAVGERSRGSEVFKDQVVVRVRFKQMKDRIVGDLIDLADDVRALLLAFRSGELDERVARNLALGGHAPALAGLPESRWLDVKRDVWRLDTAAGKAELAKDVSAMANADGGMILIPATTTIVSGREVVGEVRDMPVELVNIAQLRGVLKDRVFPPLPELVTEVVVTAKGRGRLVVAVGKHRADSWPHLVVGDPEADFKTQSVSAWIRDGDSNRALSAPELHALMRARESHDWHDGRGSSEPASNR